MRRVATFVAVALLGAAAPAHALCPNCLGQASTLSTTLKIIGAFLLVPPAVFFAVAIAIRRLSRRETP